MNWTPELVYGTIGAVTTGAVTIVGALHKLKWIRIPLRRTNGNNQFSGMSVSDIEKRCRDIHAGVDHRLIEIGEANSGQASDIKNMEKRLDKGDEKFEKIQQSLATINRNIGIMDTKFELREKDYEKTLSDATQTMTLILEKIKD